MYTMCSTIANDTLIFKTLLVQRQLQIAKTS